MQKICNCEQATESIKKILAVVKIRDIEAQLLEMIKRLMNGESYTSKFAAINIIPVIFPSVSASSQ